MTAEFIVYVTSSVELNLVIFYSGTSMQTLHSVPTCLAIHLLVDTYLKHNIHCVQEIKRPDITKNILVFFLDTRYTDKMRVNNALAHD